jgi:hypothetical protein
VPRSGAERRPAREPLGGWGFGRWFLDLFR